MNHRGCGARFQLYQDRPDDLSQQLLLRRGLGMGSYQMACGAVAHHRTLGF